jgi:hypothetical protein
MMVEAAVPIIGTLLYFRNKLSHNHDKFTLYALTGQQRERLNNNKYTRPIYLEVHIDYHRLVMQIGREIAIKFSDYNACV